MIQYGTPDCVTKFWEPASGKISAKLITINTITSITSVFGTRIQASNIVDRVDTCRATISDSHFEAKMIFIYVSHIKICL